MENQPLWGVHLSLLHPTQISIKSCILGSDLQDPYMASKPLQGQKGLIRFHMLQGSTSKRPSQVLQGGRAVRPWQWTCIAAGALGTRPLSFKKRQRGWKEAVQQLSIFCFATRIDLQFPSLSLSTCLLLPHLGLPADLARCCPRFVGCK